MPAAAIAPDRGDHAIAFEGSYRMLGHGFRVRTPFESIARRADELLAPFRVASAATIYRIENGMLDRGELRLSIGGATLGTASSPDGLVDALLADATARALQEVTDAIAVHSGAIAWQGRGIVLPAPMDHGKTTLVAGLVRAGFDYLSDEAAVIGLEDALVHPFPRALRMSRASVGAVFREAPADRRAARVLNHYIAPSDLRPDPIGSTSPIEYVVAPSYSRGSETRLTPMSRAEALVTLLHNTFRLEAVGPRACLETLSHAIADAECYRLTIGELAAAVSLIQELVAA